MDVTAGPYIKIPYAFITPRYQTDQENWSLFDLQLLLPGKSKQLLLYASSWKGKDAENICDTLFFSSNSNT